MGSEIDGFDIDKIFLNEREKPLCRFSELSQSVLSLAENVCASTQSGGGFETWMESLSERQRHSWVARQFARLKSSTKLYGWPHQTPT